MKVVAVILFLFLLSASSFGQQVRERNLDVSALVDEIFALQDGDFNYEDLYENYLQLLSNPFNLNSVTDEQLRSLMILTDAQIASIIRHRTRAGEYLSIYELQVIEEIDRETFNKIAPFLTTTTSGLNKNLFKRILAEENNYLILRYGRTVESQAGYKSETPEASRYLGSPDKLYTRFRTSKPGDFSIGFTTEKDAGERLSTAQHDLAFDYVSFHVQLLQKKAIKNLIIGDYQAQFGQGLTLGSAFGVGKNGETITTVRRSSFGFAPHTSLMEATFFRGAAVSYKLTKNWQVHTMVSTRKRDGSIDADAAEGNIVSSLGLSGLHRTRNELANRNTIDESNLGGVINFKKNNFEIGGIAHHTQFSLPVVREQNIYNQYQFRGTKNLNVGGYFNYSISNYSFFGEFTQSKNHGFGAVGGLLASLSSKLDVSFLLRRYDRNFYTFYSNALAENTTPQNEQGFYSGWKYTVNKKISLAGYLDLFKFPWLRFRSYAPSVGNEWLVRINYKPSKVAQFFIQYREETKVRNSSSDLNLYTVQNVTRRNFWINADYQPAEMLKLRTRLQLSSVDAGGSVTRGLVMLQDITYTKNRFSISGRHAIFDTDNYDNRLYIFEQDVWLGFSFPPYYGKGIRQLALMEYQVNKRLTLWLRWARTVFTDREEIGSGGETIAGNQRNDVKFQARIKF